LRLLTHLNISKSYLLRSKKRTFSSLAPPLSCVCLPFFLSVLTSFLRKPVGSWSLRNLYDESQSLIFLSFMHYLKVQNQSSFSLCFQTRVLASQWVSDFTIYYPLFCIPSYLFSKNSLESFHLQVIWIIVYSAVHFP